MKLVSGRFPVPSDSITEYVINETYARFLGFKNPADAVGKFIGEKETRTPIVGVMEDFYSQSLHTPIKPLVFTAIKSNQTTLHILLKPDNGNDVWKTAIEKIEASFKSVYPAQDFQYQFLDDSIAKFYKNEQDILTLLNWATGLAILISCLGLLGLVIYSTNQRTKEIGVRKVLGASVLQIVVLIATDFMKLVLLAFIIAVPLAWTGTDRWLQNFAYRTEISWWIFVAAGASMVVTALITLGFRTVKVAMANPVDSLRTE
jgi:ABC-type antimicrobial peptide transport system permease subunit